MSILKGKEENKTWRLSKATQLGKNTSSKRISDKTFIVMSDMKSQ